MPPFQFSLDKRLRTLGLEGKLAWATMHDGALQLQDESNHVVRIGLTDIARIRIGFMDGKWRTYHVRVWRDALDKPFEITPSKQYWRPYRETIGALVQEMAARNLLDRVETGTSKFDALLGPALMSIPTLAALAIALFVLTEEPWWGRVIVPIAPTAISAVLIWYGRKRYWPRPLRDIRDLKVQLPPG